MAVSWIAYSIENVLGQSKWKLIVLSAQAQIKVAVHCLVMTNENRWKQTIYAKWPVQKLCGVT